MPPFEPVSTLSSQPCKPNIEEEPPHLPIKSHSRFQPCICAAALAFLSVSTSTWAAPLVNTEEITTTLGDFNTTDVINEGTINTFLEHGMMAGNSNDPDSDVLAVNRGSITTTGSDSNGISVNAQKGATVTNTTGARISASGGRARGISVDHTETARVDNQVEAEISVSGAGSRGIYVNSKVATVSNGEQARISASDVNSRTVDVNSTEAATVTNNGIISSTGTHGVGINLKSQKVGTVINNGIIEAKGKGVTGIDASMEEGNILVTHHGIISTSGEESIAIFAAGSGDPDKITTVSNDGVISTSGIESHALYLSNITGMTNTGTITTDKENSHGIYIDGGTTSVANTGIISVTGSGSVELYVSSNTTANVTTWATAFEPTGTNRVFGVASDATLHFDNTHLILNPASGPGLTFDISDMVEKDPAATVTGHIASISSGIPMLATHLSLIDPDAPDLWDNQQVSFSVITPRSYGQQANVTAVRNMQNRFWLASRTLSSALTTAHTATNEWSSFAQSYHLNAGATGNARSSSDSTGFVFGGTKRVNPDVLAGFHAGYDHTDMDAKHLGLKGDAESWLLGLHGRYDFTKESFIRGQLSASVSRSDYDFTMTGDSAKDRRTEYALFANATGGYDFRINESSKVTPEIGLAYLYMKNPSMNVDWTREANRDLNVSTDSSHYSAAFATAALKWTGSFKQADATVSPTLAAGIRQILTNGRIKGDMEFYGSHYGSYITDDRTVGTLEAGLKFTRKNLSMAIRYNGNFGSDTHDNIVWGEFGYAF